tara:strand:+ start:170 stop:406 length:237 start_codon:yes stop_codon:yes gene_type:complete
MTPIQTIVDREAERLGIPAEWVSTRRVGGNSRSSVLLRGAVCYAAKVDGWSEPEIAAQIGADAATVHCCAKRHEGKMQ